MIVNTSADAKAVKIRFREGTAVERCFALRLPGQLRDDVHGLPVVGFAARSFRNGTLHCAAGSGTTPCQGNYGGNFTHRYKRSITPAP